MTKIKRFAQNRTFLFSVAVTALFALCLRCSGLLYNLLPQFALKNFLFEIFDILWPVALVLLFGYGFIFRRKGFVNTLIPGMAPLCLRTVLVVNVIILSIAERVQWQTMPVILTGILSMIGIGIREEVVFRGIICNALVSKYGTSKKGLWFAVIVSAACFSVMHLQNLIHGIAPMALVAQLISAFTMGLVLAAIYVRGGNIWVPILIHAITDASGLFQSTFTVTAVSGIQEMSGLSILGSLVLLPIHISLTIFLLRKSKQSEIFARLEQLREEIQG